MKKQRIEEVRAFNRVYTVFMGILNKSYLKSDFSLVETRVMYAAISKDGIMPSEIVALLNVDKSYLSRIIARLEKRRVITKTKSPSDGRSIRLAITEYGRKEFEKLNQASNIQVEGLLSQLNAKDCELLVKRMSEIRAILERQ